MADKTVVRKSVVYRQFKPVEGDFGAKKLAALLVDALEKTGENGRKLKDDWTQRRYPDWDTRGHHRFSYALHASENTLFGMLCLYSPNEYMAMIREEAEERAAEEHISLDEAMQQVEIAEREPPAGEHYLKGHSYFLVVDSHVLVVQHNALRANALEQYLHDLLRGTGVITPGHAFILDGVLSLAKSGSALGDIRAVEVGGVIARPTHKPDSEDIITETLSTEEVARARSTNKGKAILDLMLGSTRADKIMSTVPPEAELEVDVRFGFQARQRKVNRAALAQIASAARDLPEGQVRAVGKDGKAKGDDLRLQSDMPFRLVRENGALLDVSDARTQLMRVYSRFVEDGKITP